VHVELKAGSTEYEILSEKTIIITAKREFVSSPFDVIWLPKTKIHKKLYTPKRRTVKTALIFGSGILEPVH